MAQTFDLVAKGLNCLQTKRNSFDESKFVKLSFVEGKESLVTMQKSSYFASCVMTQKRKRFNSMACKRKWNNKILLPWKRS